jgi:hypothetical protein
MMWQKPLEKAEYQLIVPQDISVAGFSIPYHKSVTGTSETVYLWNFENYMPESDLIFRFEGAE